METYIIKKHGKVVNMGLSHGETCQFILGAIRNFLSIYFPDERQTNEASVHFTEKILNETKDLSEFRWNKESSDFIEIIREDKCTQEELEQYQKEIDQLVDN